jgi:hypothetical protein
MAEIKKIAAEFGPRYRKAGKSEKARILDEYLALSGGKSRKYAIFKLNRVGKTQLRVLNGETVRVKTVEKSRKKRVYQPYYGPEVAETLELLWRNFNGFLSDGPAGSCSLPSSRGTLTSSGKMKNTA